MTISDTLLETAEALDDRLQDAEWRELHSRAVDADYVHTTRAVCDLLYALGGYLGSPPDSLIEAALKGEDRLRAAIEEADVENGAELFDVVMSQAALVQAFQRHILPLIPAGLPPRTETL